MSARPNSFTVAFYVAFALWFTATQYSGGPSFYSWLLAPVVDSALGLAITMLFFIAVILAGRRALRTLSFPWFDIAVVGFAIIGFDLFWRFYLSPLAWDAFKLTSAAIEMATPLIVVLGLTAVVTEYKRHAPAVGS